MGEKKRRIEAGGSTTAARPVKAEAKRFGGMRITWKAVGLFMGLMVVLDVIFFAIFHFGLGSCWGILCLIG